MFSLLSPLVTVGVIKRENSPLLPLPPPPSIALYIPLVQLLHLTSPNPASTLACSRDLCSLLVFTLKSYLFFEIISSPLIGRYNKFGFGFMTLNQKAILVILLLSLFANDRENASNDL